jgi:hypothetical protein
LTQADGTVYSEFQTDSSGNLTVKKTGNTVTFTGDQVSLSNLGIEFAESDTNPGCVAGNFTLFADLSENKLKKCQNGAATDLDTSSGGTVTSVGLVMPSQFTVTGSPVIGAGDLTAAWASQSANLILASPNGSAGAPTFRALTDDDVPNALTINGATVNNTVIGGVTPAAATFTTVQANTSLSVAAGANVNLEGSSGDTYMVYSASEGKLWVDVNGPRVAWFRD